MTETLDRPQMGMMWYRSGKWLVSSPLFIGPPEEQEKSLVCPHGTYQEFQRQIVPVEETGVPELIIAQKCTGCTAKRFLRYPMEEPSEQEMFKQQAAAAPPVPENFQCEDFERTYNFGAFQVLVRLHQLDPAAPPTRLVMVTAGNQRHVEILTITEISFAEAAIEVFRTMERVLRLGADRFANVKLLEERRMRSDLPEMQRYAAEIFAVAQTLGPEMIARAAAGLQEERLKEQAEAQEQEVSEFEEQIAENEAKLVELRRILAEGEAVKAPARELKRLKELIAEGEGIVAQQKEQLRMYREGQQQ